MPGFVGIAGFTRVLATQAEIDARRAAFPNSPRQNRLRCNVCGERVWHTGTGAHRRKCATTALPTSTKD